MGVITISIVIIRSIWHYSAADFFFAFLENFCRKFANVMAPPTDGTTKRLVRCKAHLVLKRRKRRPNPCIIGDAILPQTGKKLTKNAVRNLAVCCGARHLTPHRKRNIGAQLQSITRIKAPKSSTDV